MSNKQQVAQLLADAHYQIEPSIEQIIRLISSEEDQKSEPIKLLEVNPDTSPSGIIPIAFSPDPPDIPFASVVIEITPEEFLKFKQGKLHLPEGWNLGETLFKRN